MGCFSTCFPKSKHRKSLGPRKATSRLDQLLQSDEDLEALQLTHCKEPEKIEKPIDPLPDKEDEQREKLNMSGRKKVTFDLNVKIYEGLPAEEEGEGDFVVKSSNAEEEEEEGKPEKKQQRANREKESQCHSDSSSSSSLFSFPHNSYRYQNCRDSDDEFDQLVSDDESDLDHYEDGDEDDEEDNEGEKEVNNDHLVVQEESSESLFSLSIDSRKHKLSPEMGDKEVNSPMPVKSSNVKHAKTAGVDEDEPDRMSKSDSVLQPVENLAQWKAMKARAKLASQKKAKQNKILVRESKIPISEEPILKPQVNSHKAKSKCLHKEIAVDTSLSSWLVDCEAATPSKSKTSSASVGNSPCSDRTSSPKDFEDRPILGALTVEEMEQLKAASTPRRSPSRSPDDMPIMGTVGSYWSHTGQGSNSNSGSGASNTRSNFREGSRANINSSTPFEKRLERALEKGHSLQII